MTDHTHDKGAEAERQPFDAAAHALKGGAEYPYDAQDDSAAPPAVDWAHAAARAVLYDLTDRRGIKHGFRGIDGDVRVEIVASLAEIIRRANPSAAVGAEGLPPLPWGDDYLDVWLEPRTQADVERAIHDYAREAIAADRQARAGQEVEQPAAAPIKDHEIRDLVNTLRDIAVQYHATQQLRARLQDVVLPFARRASGAAQASDGREWIVFGGRRMGRTYLARLEWDAARYREVRMGTYKYGIGNPSPEQLDMELDRVILAAKSAKEATKGSGS